MKKIIRLTESDLTRLVRRVINESTDQQKYQQLYDAVSGLGTDEESFIKTIESIKDKSEYDRINAIGKSKGEDIVTLFDGDFGGGTESVYFERFCTKLNNLKVPLPKSCNMSFMGYTLNQTYSQKPKPAASIR
jgi:hypothetical protein